MCNALHEGLRAVVSQENTVASDAFVYFDAGDPNRKLAPDAFLKLGVAQHHFNSWKTWNKGTPELAFEVLSPSDSPERITFEEKLVRYRALGVEELIVFHADGEPGTRLRAWDRIDEDLVERVVEREQTPCVTLGLMVVVAPVADLATGLRLVRDGHSIPTEAEARRAEVEARRAAERRVAELEALLERSRQG